MSLSEAINNPMVQTGYRVLSQVFDQFQSLDPNLLFNILFLNHAFIVALMVKRAFNGLIATQKVKEIPFVAGMLLCFAIGTGGAILTSLLLGKTQIFFTNDTINLYLICAWIITIYAPFNLVDWLIGNVVVQLFTFAIEGFFVAGFCINGVNTGVTEYPQSTFAPIILGTTACVGGAILRPFFVNLYIGESVENSVLSSPNFVLKAPILTSIFFYVTKHIYKMSMIHIPLGYLPFKELENVTLSFTPEHVLKAYFTLHFIMIYAKSHPAFMKAPKKISTTNTTRLPNTPPPTKQEPPKVEKKKETKKNK